MTGTRPAYILTGFRLDTTGAYEYAYYHEKERVCSIRTLVIPRAPIMISGRTRNWHSILHSGNLDDPNGLIRDAETRQELIRLTASAEGFCHMFFLDPEVFPIQRLDIIEVSFGYLFYLIREDGQEKRRQLFAALRRTETSDWIPETGGIEIEPAFCAECYSGDPGEELLLAMLSFPMFEGCIPVSDLPAKAR